MKCRCVNRAWVGAVVLANDYSGPGPGWGSDPNGVVSPARAFNSGPLTTHTPAVANPTAGSDAGVHQLTTPTTLSGTIRSMPRADPAGPRITYYDDATGERIELSADTG